MSPRGSDAAADFYRFAIGLHEARVARETARFAAEPGSRDLKRTAGIAALDLLSWAVNYRVDVLGIPVAVPKKPCVPDAENADHCAIGVKWIRDGVAHGSAHLIELSMGQVGPTGWDSKYTLWDDPETRWDEDGDSPTLRFGESTERPKDLNPARRKFYNECLVGHRIVTVAALISAPIGMGPLL